MPRTATERTRPVDPVREQKTKPLTTAAPGETADEVRRLVALVETSSDPEREARVDALRAQIEAGTYHPSADEIAESILSNPF